MRVLNVRNVHEALPEGLRLLEVEGVCEDSRNGRVVVAPWPVATVYERPTERVIFWPERDANPFFHLFEALWMLAGRNDVDYVAQYVGRMRSFSDDGKTLHGAYGHRWRRHFGGRDQLLSICAELNQNPSSRRVVLAMWDPGCDLRRDGKDLPCNTHAYFRVSPGGALDMTVCCRSNDIIWGAYGANAVHFSVLQEFVASALGRPVGTYTQISNNYHAYEATHAPLAHLADEARCPFRRADASPYAQRPLEVEPFPLLKGTDIAAFECDLSMFLDDPTAVGFRTPFFRRVAAPLWSAWACLKSDAGDRFEAAQEKLRGCRATDWRRAAAEWIERRRVRAEQKETEDE